MGETPFIHNRSYTKKCYLTSEDEIYFDYNRAQTKSDFIENEESCENYPTYWPKDIPFLLEGETGTGKSSLAKKLHYKFQGEETSFVGINLSALNPSLIESELFGHEKGAFTGAIRDKKGAVEMAKGGTLFLDEIDSLDLSMQVKLLTFLDHLLYRRVGGEREFQADCRIIFASGSSLKRKVLKGEFRADLFYRIQSGIYQRLSSLREDKSLIEKALMDFSRKTNLSIDRKLYEYYQSCDWPGNYRQLLSHLKRKQISHYGSQKIFLCSLDEDLEMKMSIENTSESLEEVKKSHCRKVFVQSQGSFSIAAKRLEISKNTLKKMVA